MQVASAHQVHTLRGSCKRAVGRYTPFSSSNTAPRQQQQQQQQPHQQNFRQYAQQHGASLRACSALRRSVMVCAKKQPAMSEEADLDVVAMEAEEDADERMKKAVAVMVDNFNTMRTGRANPAILDRIQVEYYGSPTPIKSLASIAVPEASSLVITPFDKGCLKDIEKAILESDIGINPNNDGERIRLIIPQMTQDRRKELAKKVSKMGEDGKVAVRNVRKDIIKRLDKYDFPKDTKKALEDDIQKHTDANVKQIDELVKSKTEDIMKV